MSLTADLSQLRKLRTDLLKVSERVKDKNALLTDAGAYMCETEIPKVFMESGPGWPTSTTGSKKPLIGKGPLRASMVYSVSGDTVTVGSHLPYAGLMNEGGTVTSKGKLLVVPSNNLTNSEMTQIKTQGFKTFCSNMKTYLIPSTTSKGYLVFQRRNRRGGVSNDRLLATLVPSVTIPQRKFLDFGTRALDAISRRWTKLVMEGK